MKGIYVSNFTEWKNGARACLSAQVAPTNIHWSSGQERSLFESVSNLSPNTKYSVPKTFIPLAETASCHTDPTRWDLLYRILWRITHGEHHLLEIATDPDISKLLLLVKGIRRDIHKMHAFVRFTPTYEGDETSLSAWYEPLYNILEKGTPFFVRRFGLYQWKIVTPQGSATWDKKSLRFNPNETTKPKLSDDVETLWQDYYSSIYNPARTNLRMMTKEMPARNWKNLPEARVISSLIANAPLRVRTMKPLNAEAPVPDISALPSVSSQLASLASATNLCTACPLFQGATQAVFGEGPAIAKVVFVGEQPGDEEDTSGKPFVGPAGQLLDSVMKEVGLERSEIYVTNAVKHFKFEQRGKRRLHKRPNSSEIHACRSWIRTELSVIKPELVVCLGATAAQSVLGRAVKVTDERGKFQSASDGTRVLVTIHPSAVLRTTDEIREKMYGWLRDDLASIKGEFPLLRLHKHQRT